MTKLAAAKPSTASRRAPRLQAPPSQKVAISLPFELYAAMETARAGVKQDRSGWIQEAVREYLTDRKREAEIAQYIRGYEEVPETDEERAIVAAAVNDPLPPYAPE